jgi:HK97 family phage portal protein
MLNRLSEKRSLSYQAIWGAGSEVADTTTAGAIITDDTALEINAFYACVSLIADTISTLPVDAFERRNGTRTPYRPKPAWLYRPDVDLNKNEHFQQVLVSMMMDGNAFIRVFRDDTGAIVNLVVLNPTKVRIERSAIGRKFFYYEGESRALTSDDVLHIADLLKPGEIRGVGRIDKLRENLGLATALQSFAARFFGQGAQTSGIIEFPGELTLEQARDLAKSFDNRHSGYRKAHKTGVLSGGAKFTQTNVPNDQAQFLDSRRLAVEDIARAFLVPPHMIGLNNGSMSYASVEQNAIFFVQHTLRPYIVKLEDAYSRLLPNGVFIRFNVDGLLRGDFATRVAGYSSGLQSGWLRINDVRAYEELPPIEGGDIARVPLANVNINAADLVETDKRVAMAQKLIVVGFSPEEVLAALDLPSISHSGVPSTQLQPVSMIDPADPGSVYEGK